MIAKPINETLPSSASDPALFEIGNAPQYSDWAIQARGSVDIHISDTEDMAKYWTIKSGTALSVSQVLTGGSDMFYARSSGDADTIEILPLRA